MTKAGEVDVSAASCSLHRYTNFEALSKGLDNEALTQLVRLELGVAKAKSAPTPAPIACHLCKPDTLHRKWTRSGKPSRPQSRPPLRGRQDLLGSRASCELSIAVNRVPMPNATLDASRRAAARSYSEPLRRGRAGTQSFRVAP